MLAVCVAAQPAGALEIPELRARVVDRAGVLGGAEARALEQILAEFERAHGHQVVVHVTPSLEGLEIEDYSIRIAEAWKVGDRALDNGVILTVAPNERKVRIEVGYGLEGVLPDALAGRIIREQILPEFRAGRVDRGIEAGTRAILAVISGEVLARPARGAGDRSEIFIMVLWIAVALALILARQLFFAHALGGPGIPRSRRAGGFPVFGGGRSGGGFGGGGFSGGGGGFGGGGASGRW